MKSALKCFRHKKGFTLIELIMTVVVVGVAAVPLALFLNQSLESTFQSADYTMAVDLGRYEMEGVKNMAYAAIVNANFSSYLGYRYNVTRTVTFVFGSPSTPESLKRIRVDVRRSGDTTILLTLITFIAGNVAYGV